MVRCLFGLILLLAACAPLPSVPQPIEPIISPLPASTTLNAQTPSQTAEVSETPAVFSGGNPTLQPGRLDLPAAQEFLTTWYAQRMLPLEEPLPIAEITPDEVWREMQVQIYLAREPFSPYTSTFLVYHGEAWSLETGYTGQGVLPEDLLAADLDRDGIPELAYVYTLGHEIGQASHLGVFQTDDSPPGFLSLDWSYPGEVDLQRAANGQVQALGNPYGSSERTPLGNLIRQGKLLSLVEDPSQIEKQAVYTNPRFAISLQYPASWQQVEEDHFQGENGFFHITPYESVASGLSDIYDGLSFRMIRACTWELNAEPGKYGSYPQARLSYEAPGMARCQIIPSTDASDAQPSLLFETLDGGLALLQADPAQLALVQQTIEVEFPPGEGPPSGQRAYSAENVFPDLTLETQTFGDLTLEEYRLFPDTVHTPDEIILAEALAGIRQTRAAWREAETLLSGESRLVHDNAILEGFGYHIEGSADPQGEGIVSLYQGETLLKDNLQLWSTPLALDQDENGIHDFAILFEARDPTQTRAWLLTRAGLQPWEMEAHLYTAPVFINDQLASIVLERLADASRLSVTLDSETVYTMQLPWYEPLTSRLDAWEDTWALEVDGTLVVDGEIANLSRGYGEIFNYNQLAGKPFFFFEKDDHIRLFYDGEELPVKYAEVIHAQCCGGLSNPHHCPDMLSFYARRDGIWYYAEIGKYS